MTPPLTVVTLTTRALQRYRSSFIESLSLHDGSGFVNSDDDCRPEGQDLILSMQTQLLLYLYSGLTNTDRATMFKGLLGAVDGPCSQPHQGLMAELNGDAGVVMPLQLVSLLTGMLDLSMASPNWLKKQRTTMVSESQRCSCALDAQPRRSLNIECLHSITILPTHPNALRVHHIITPKHY